MVSACVSSFGLNPILRASGLSSGLNGVAARSSHAGGALRPMVPGSWEGSVRHAVLARPRGLKAGIVDVDLRRGMAHCGEIP